MAVKLNVGAGGMSQDGYISIDLYDPQADVQADILALPYEDNSVDEIVAYQVIEHIPYHKEDKLFRELHRVLKPRGVLITECPDIEYVAKQILKEGLTDKWIFNLYGQYARDEWQGAKQGMQHLNGYTWQRIQTLADTYGFTVTRNPMDKKHPNYRYEENLSCRWVKRAS